MDLSSHHVVHLMGVKNRHSLTKLGSLHEDHINVLYFINRLFVWIHSDMLLTSLIFIICYLWNLCKYKPIMPNGPKIITDVL